MGDYVVPKPLARLVKRMGGEVVVGWFNACIRSCRDEVIVGYCLHSHLKRQAAVNCLHRRMTRIAKEYLRDDYTFEK